MQQFLEVMTYCVSMPVWAEKTYSTWPSWSLRLVLQGFGRHVLDLIIHLHVPVDEDAVLQVNEFGYDEHGHGRHDTEQDGEAPAMRKDSVVSLYVCFSDI